MNKHSILEALKELDGLVCGICHQPLEEQWAKYQIWREAVSKAVKAPFRRQECDITIDHKIPKSLIRKQPEWEYKKGWWYDDIQNLQLAHNTCNNKKVNSTPVDSRA